MGIFTRKQQSDDGAGGALAGLSIDLERPVCPVCRRELLPWAQTCPEDGATAVAREDLPAPPGPPAHLLGPDPDQDADTTSRTSSSGTPSEST